MGTVIIILLIFSGLLLPAPVAADSPPNVLLITVDTLRADHLSSYGYHLKTSPNMDRLAEAGVRFDPAYTTIPLTGPAHYSLFTSHYPQEHGARINGVAVPNDLRALFLPQILRTNGYKNAAFVSAWPLTSRLTHLDRWFDHYDEDLTRNYQLFNSSRYAEDVTPRAIDWLKKNHKNRFFLWVHYFDPHSPYHLRKEFSNLPESGHAAQAPPDQDEAIRKRIAEYDSEVAYTDHYIGRLLDTVDALKARNNTLVVLTADHGESLGEHSYVGHGRHLYENIVRIPLIVRLPGTVEAGKVVDRGVSLLDITPTIVDLAVRQNGRKLPLDVPFSGRSLAPVLTSDAKLSAQSIRYVTFPGKKGFAPKWLSWIWTSDNEEPLHIGRSDGSRKLIWSPRDEILTAYDVRKDPFELSPSVSEPDDSAYERESARLERWFTSTDTGATGEDRLSERDIEVLKSLGYVQ